jgi:hypothetical protein
MSVRKRIWKTAVGEERQALALRLHRPIRQAPHENFCAQEGRGCVSAIEARHRFSLPNEFQSSFRLIRQTKWRRFVEQFAERGIDGFLMRKLAERRALTSPFTPIIFLNSHVPHQGITFPSRVKFPVKSCGASSASHTAPAAPCQTSRSAFWPPMSVLK